MDGGSGSGEPSPADAPDGPRTRVLIDGAILRRPPTGTARWVEGIAAALGHRRDVAVQLARGAHLIQRLGPLHRLPNLALERWWYEVDINRAATRFGADLLLMPANLSARRTRIPQVVTILDVNFLTQPGTYERTFVRYATWAYRRAGRDAAALATISAFSRDEIATHLDIDPARFAVVYPGLDPVAPSSASPSPHPRPYALYAGATERHKNVGMLLDAWERDSPAGLDLAIVGQPGRAHDDLVSRAERIGGRARVVGRVDQRALDAWYRHASVFLFPSRVEGFGFPPLEAMQRGVPVVSSTGGSLPEVLRDAALFVDPDDPDALRTHVLSLADDQPLRSGLVARGHALVSGYTWDATARSLVELGRHVLGRG